MFQQSVFSFTVCTLTHFISFLDSIFNYIIFACYLYGDEWLCSLNLIQQNSTPVTYLRLVAHQIQGRWLLFVGPVLLDPLISHVQKSVQFPFPNTTLVFLAWARGEPALCSGRKTKKEKKNHVHIWFHFWMFFWEANECVCGRDTEKETECICASDLFNLGRHTRPISETFSGGGEKKSSLNSSGLDAYRRRHGALSLPLSVAASHAQTEICARTRCTRNTRALVSLLFAHTHTQPRTQRERNTQKMLLSVFGCSVTAGAEKAMCLRWQVHSGVSSVPTTRLQNNITMFSRA